MSGWDEGQVFVRDQNLAAAGVDDGAPPANDVLIKRFREFIRTFVRDNVFIYREQLMRRHNLKETFLEVDLDDLAAFDEALSSELLLQPSERLHLFETAAKDALVALGTDEEDVGEVQVVLTSSANPISIRTLTASSVSNMVQIPGIIISASRPRAKATHVTIQCKGCSTNKQIPVHSGFGGVQLPRKCDRTHVAEGEAQCPLDPYVVVPEKSRFVDQQTLKLQECPEDVPTGEMPRNIMLSVDRSLVNLTVPGQRLTIMGIFSVYTPQSKRNGPGGVAIKQPYIRVVGMQIKDKQQGSVMFHPDEEAEFLALAREPELLNQKLLPSIAPGILGLEEVKRAVACQLFGGSRKMLPDGMRLRGDINVLLMGDPSVAKSQVLKFMEKVAPICIYTSGKGSSAAGLTASVVRDPTTYEFYLEGGAMVLADGGVVCIDEFDKMRNQDRVAIHEAMEQQTISIAKAGITTILNSRTSVLAAANPVFGRYDDSKDADENIDLMTTILSRFDMIFILKDTRDEEKDRMLAKHILGVHMNMEADEKEGELSVGFIKRYVQYCKAKCAPRLSEDACEVLKNTYVTIRQEIKKRSEATDTPSTIPITVRQLEAIVRIAESLAKMTLSPIATSAHVDEAIRIFKISTYDAANAGVPIEGNVSATDKENIDHIENVFKRRVAVSSRKNITDLVKEFTEMGYEEPTIKRAVWVMSARGDVKYMQNKRVVLRVR